MTAAKTQKLLIAGIVLKYPDKKANELVNDVIVMDGPACPRASLSRSSGERLMEV